MGLDEQFEAAVWIIQALPKDGPIKTTINDQLMMYALFKQGTIGKCNTEQPYFYKIEERLKWNSWNELGDMEKDEAKARYVEKMLQLCDKAEKEHDMMNFLNDPSVAHLLPKQDEIRSRFATLGRTTVKGYEGKTVSVNGVSISL
uniref:ACB domain-containing protein n=1 Tax=Caenorhabditis japonica TaxID=281687 RepID=A0A8R1HMH0_CAEJA